MAEIKIHTVERHFSLTPHPVMQPMDWQGGLLSLINGYFDVRNSKHERIPRKALDFA